MTPHPFRPDHVGEPGYRSRCRDCGQERHPERPQIPAQRAGGLPVPDKPPDAPTEALRAITAHSATDHFPTVTANTTATDTEKP